MPNINTSNEQLKEAYHHNWGMITNLLNFHHDANSPKNLKKSLSMIYATLPWHKKIKDRKEWLYQARNYHLLMGFIKIDLVSLLKPLFK